MRIALVSPYSWTFPGGVARHVEALAGELLAQGHDVRVLTPVDRNTRLAAWLHAGAGPAARPLPEHVVALGGTVGLRANGAVSNLALTPSSVVRLRHELRTGGFDVVHVHSPDAPAISWDAVMASPAPVVATFHAYSTSRRGALALICAGAVRRFNRMAVRIAVSPSAAWTAARWGAGPCRVIPNGVHLPPAPARPAMDGDGDGGELDVVFVGQAVERKGLPVLLGAFEALRDHVPARLTLVGPGPDDVAPLLLDGRGVVALGTVGEEAKAAVLARADVLCAPSLGGESFGMVLTEALAHGTPVVASRIPGYAGVVRDGVEGLLVPRGDPAALAASLREMALDPELRRRLGVAARRRAERFAWPRVAEEVAGAYEDALAAPRPSPGLAAAAIRHGLRPADGGRAPRPRRLAGLEPREDAARRGSLPAAARAALVVVALGALAGAAAVLERIGVEAVAGSVLAAKPLWVLAALGTMGASMALRALAWHAILRAALPAAPVRAVDALRATSIGVLMSATLPARLGEPSRAFILARRLGRARDHLPIVLGTLVSQTLLNVLALVLLGAAVLAGADLLREHALVATAAAPVVILAGVLAGPAAARAGGHAAIRRTLARVRQGLRVFGRPRLALAAVAAQLGAWGLQALACWQLLVALGLDDRAGPAAAAAVLFAVNATAVLPAVPANLGVFQAACVVVLATYGVGHADALAYGIVLQAVELATAVAMGTPALVGEGLSWREVRLRALAATPVTLAPDPRESPVRSG